MDASGHEKLKVTVRWAIAEPAGGGSGCSLIAFRWGSHNIPPVILVRVFCYFVFERFGAKVKLVGWSPGQPGPVCAGVCVVILGVGGGGGGQPGCVCVCVCVCVCARVCP